MTEAVPDVRRPSPIALVAWSLFALLAVYTVMLGGGWAGIYATGLRSLSLALIAVGLTAWAGLAILRRDWRPTTAIWPAVIAPPVALAVSTAASPMPRVGVEYVAWSILLVALYLFLVRIVAHPFGRARVGSVAAGLALVVGLAYVWEVVSRWLEFWELVGRITPPPLRPGFGGLGLGNPSAVMTVEVLLFLAAFAGLGTASRGRRVTLGIIAVLTLFAIVVSGSRAGWLGLAIAVGGVGVLWLLAPGHRGRLGRWLGDRRVRVGLVAGGVIGAILAVAIVPGLLLRTGAGGEALRTQYVIVVARQFADAPIVGRGAGSWTAERIWRTAEGEPDYYIPHAHNIYAQAAGELGLVGLLAGAVLAAGVLWLIVVAIRGESAERQRWAWCGLLGLAYFAAHQLLDFYPNMPAALFAAAIPVALLDATSTGRLPGPIGRQPRWIGRAGIAALAVACVVSIAGLARAEQIAGVEQTAVTAANDGDLATSLPLARAAAQDDPAMPAYQLMLGLAAAEAGTAEETLAALERAADTDDLPQAWLDIAWGEAARGNDDAAREAVDRALRLGIQQPAVAYAAGWLLDRLGDDEAARAAWVQALILLPSLANDPPPDLGDQPDAESRRWPEIVDEAQAAAPGWTAWELALVGEREADALELAALTDDPDFAALVTRGWHGDTAAIAEVERLADANPLREWYIGWAARLNAQAGDHEAAERFREWGALVAGGASFIGYDARLATPAEARADGARAGTSATFHGHYVYRRPLAWDLLVGDLPRLAFE